MSQEAQTRFEASHLALRKDKADRPAMTEDLRLPPVDIYRQPFVEPLGHLVLACAKLEAAAIRFFGLAALSPSERTNAFDWHHAATAWELKQERKVQSRIEAIDDVELREGVRNLWAARCQIQSQRNRFIHDVIDLGLFQSGDGGWVVEPLLGPNMQDRSFNAATSFRHVRPHDVASLALLADETARDFDLLADTLPKEPWPEMDPTEEWTASDD